MHINIEHPIEQRNALDTGFLEYFPDRRSEHVLALVDMAAGLQPCAQIAVMNEQQPSVRAIENKRTCSDVAGLEVVCRESLWSLLNEIVNVADGCNLGCGRVVFLEETPQVLECVTQELGHSTNSMMHISAPSPRRGPSLTIRV